MWSATPACHIAQQTCPTGYIGKSVYLCDYKIHDCNVYVHTYDHTHGYVGTFVYVTVQDACRYVHFGLHIHTGFCHRRSPMVGSTCVSAVRLVTVSGYQLNSEMYWS